jgi:hypothetical protein
MVPGTVILCTLLWIQNTRIIVQWHLIWYMHERAGLHGSNWIRLLPVPAHFSLLVLKLISWFWFSLFLMIWETFKCWCGYFCSRLMLSKDTCRIWGSHGGGSIFWDITPCSPLNVHSKHSSAFTLVSCSAYSSTLNMEAICYSETSVDFQRTTRRYIPGESTML